MTELEELQRRIKLKRQYSQLLKIEQLKTETEILQLTALIEDLQNEKEKQTA